MKLINKIITRGFRTFYKWIKKDILQQVVKVENIYSKYILNIYKILALHTHSHAHIHIHIKVNKMKKNI